MPEDNNISFEESLPTETVPEEQPLPPLLSLPMKIGLTDRAETSRRVSFIFALILLIVALFLFVHGGHHPPKNPSPDLINQPQPHGSLP